VLLLNWIVFGLGVFLGRATLSHYLLKEIMWLHFSFTWLIHPLHFNLFTIYEINISGRYELFKHWRDKSHSTRWLQAFAELVRFVVLSLKSNWRGRWTTSDAVYVWTIFVSIFIRRFICFLESDLDWFCVKCTLITWVMYFLGNDHESLYVNYIFPFFLRWVVYLLEKQGWYIFLENNHENVWTLIS